MAVEQVVLAVDDEIEILRLVRLILSAEGFHVLTTTDAEKALELAEHRRPDLALLDVTMPQMSGLELMRRLRERTSIPVILLSGNDHDRDKTDGLDLGADDYVVKPFDPRELTARVRSVLRRGASGADAALQTVVAGDLEVDLVQRTVRRGGFPVEMTRLEWALLSHLAANPNKVMLKTELLAKVWGPEFVDDRHYLRVLISRLRSKLEPDTAHPVIITSQPGLGYTFVAA